MSGKFIFVTDCTQSSYEDIQDLISKEHSVSLDTFRKAIGPDQWKWIKENLGYGKNFPINKDWHVGYYRSTYRGVPSYHLRHSKIEYIFTLGGKVGPSLHQETFRQFLENIDNRQLYMSLVPKELIARREQLSKMVNDLYGKDDHKSAERLDAELEELDDRIDNMLSDMDDHDSEDVNTSNTGGEEEKLDRDWSVQDDMARIYARYLAGDFEPGGPNSHMTYDTVEVDPEEAKRMGWDFRQAVDHNAKPIQRFYRYVPITKQAALAKVLKGAIWESPNLSLSNPDIQKIKSMTDQQIIDMARDAYEWKSKLKLRLRP